jgi:hypothetical protein
MITLHEIFLEADRLLIQAFKEELTAQGHHLTGALEGSIKGTIKIDRRGDATLTGTAFSYGHILDAGVSPDRIPYGGGGGGGTSKYIQGLISYFMLRGLDLREAKRAAFATANAHKQHGMPTAGSYAYSKNGQRLNFIDLVRIDAGPALDHTILTGIDAMVNETFHQTASERI